jgi:hypothetical protein
MKRYKEPFSIFHLPFFICHCNPTALLMIGSLRVFWDEMTDRVVLRFKLESGNEK